MKVRLNRKSLGARSRTPGSRAVLCVGLIDGRTILRVGNRYLLRASGCKPVLSGSIEVTLRITGVWLSRLNWLFSAPPSISRRSIV